MSKKPPQSKPSDDGSADGSADGSTDGSTATETPAKRRRRTARTSKSSSSSSITQRYRGVFVALLVVLGVGVVGFFVFSSATSSAFVCGSLLTEPVDQPSPPPPAPGEPERLGFAVEDYGRPHEIGTLEYPTCPPTSGPMGNPLSGQFFGPETEQLPNSFVHNLEHGYAIFAYAGDPGEEILTQIRTLVDTAEPSETAVSCGLPNKVMALRFDQMSTPFAVLAWDKALLLETFDFDLAMAAAAQFQDQPQAPEAGC